MCVEMWTPRQSEENEPSVPELNAEVARALKAANYATGMNLPTDAASVNVIRAFLHSGDYRLVRAASAAP